MHKPNQMEGPLTTKPIFKERLSMNLKKKSLLFIKTRPKPAFGRQGLDWDRWARIQFSQVHFGAKTSRNQQWD